MIDYVLMIVFTPDSQEVVCLKKLNRPAHLHNKWTFPGGHIEATDASIEEAASRELLEETGVIVLPHMWKLAATLGSEAQGYRLNVMTTKCSEAFTARTRTEEQVKVMRVAEVLERAAATPDQFAPEFLKLLEWSRSVVALTR